MCDLKKILQSRTKPLSISIDSDGMLVAADFAWTSKYEFGIVFKHPEGDIDIGQNGPTHREFLTDSMYGKDLEKLSYDARRELVISAYCEWTDELEEGQVPWDDDTAEALNEWLDKTADDQIAENFMIENAVDDIGNEYEPGIIIFDSLSNTVRKRLGIEKVDLGGPASGFVWAVHVGCSAEDLNKAFKKAKLPFLVN